MNCCALELDSLLLSNSHLVHLRDGEAILGLARELGLGDGAVVNLVNTVWDRLLHDDMGAGSGEKCGRSHDGRSDRHDVGGNDDIVQRQEIEVKDCVENVSDLDQLVVKKKLQCKECRSC